MRNGWPDTKAGLQQDVKMFFQFCNEQSKWYLDGR